MENDATKDVFTRADVGEIIQGLFDAAEGRQLYWIRMRGADEQAVIDTRNHGWNDGIQDAMDGMAKFLRSRGWNIVIESEDDDETDTPPPKKKRPAKKGKK